MPLVKVAGRRKQWLIDVATYTLAGGVASAAVGGALGALGGTLLPARVAGHGLPVVMVVAATALARELGWHAIPLPQLARQTRDTWAKTLSSTLTAALWGLDLGLVFTTWLTFSGIWLLVAVALLAGEPTFGAALFTSHWLGRALPLWLAPSWLTDTAGVPRVLDAIGAQRQLFQRIHIVGLVWALMILVIWLAHGIPPRS